MGEEKTGKITHEEAESQRVLIREEIAKAEFIRKQCLERAAHCETEIAASKLALADLDRREAGVAFPEPPAEAEPKKPGMGQSVGGKKE